MTTHHKNDGSEEHKSASFIGEMGSGFINPPIEPETDNASGGVNVILLRGAGEDGECKSMVPRHILPPSIVDPLA